jgi:hypothetical protein
MPSRKSLSLVESLAIEEMRRKRKDRPAKGGLSFQGRIVPTEVKGRQNFLAKSYGPKNRSVKGFLANKYFCFQ